MPSHYVLFIRTIKYSGYYTGERFVEKDGTGFPGISASMTSDKVKDYLTEDDAIKDGQYLAKLYGGNFYFDVISAATNRLKYRSSFANRKEESRQRF